MPRGAFSWFCPVPVADTAWFQVYLQRRSFLLDTDISARHYSDTRKNEESESEETKDLTFTSALSFTFRFWTISLYAFGDSQMSREARVVGFSLLTAGPAVSEQFEGSRCVLTPDHVKSRKGAIASTPMDTANATVVVRCHVSDFGTLHLRYLRLCQVLGDGAAVNVLSERNPATVKNASVCVRGASVIQNSVEPATPSACPSFRLDVGL